MSGMTAARIPRILRVTKKIIKQVTVKVNQNTTIVQGNTDAPKEVAAGHGRPLEAAAVVKLGTHQMMKVMNTIVFIKRKVKRTIKNHHQVQKF